MPSPGSYLAAIPSKWQVPTVVPPRCPYPHEFGTTSPQTPDEWMQVQGSQNTVQEDKAGVIRALKRAKLKNPDFMVVHIIHIYYIHVFEIYSLLVLQGVFIYKYLQNYLPFESQRGYHVHQRQGWRLYGDIWIRLDWIDQIGFDWIRLDRLE